MIKDFVVLKSLKILSYCDPVLNVSTETKKHFKEGPFQFHTPFSSKHQFNIKKPLLSTPQIPKNKVIRFQI